MKNFAIIGVGGYIAPRHIEAINKTGNRIVAAMDVNDSVGVLDRYTQDVAFFTDFERFEVFIDKVKGTKDEIHFISICSPNYLHSAHMKFALKNGCDVICEKPLVLSIEELNELREYEKKYGKKVNTVLQLRVHDSIIELKNKVKNANKDHYEITLDYITSRGPWYHESWKGDYKKSGGLAANIGIHFFDMLTWVFGETLANKLTYTDNKKMQGELTLQKAHVKWKLSVDKNELPQHAKEVGKTTYRSIKIDGEEIEFSDGFTDLHVKVYERMLTGEGFGLDEAKTAIRIVEDLR